MVCGDYYDGHSARRHAITLTVEGDTVRIVGDGIERSAPLSELHVSEPMGAAPRLITFPDGAVCEVRDHAALAPLLARTGHQDHFVVRWQFSLRWIAASLLLCIALVAAGYRYGLPWVAARAAERIPPSVVVHISRQTLEALDQAFFTASRSSPQRQQELAIRFARMLPPAGETVPHSVLFRSSKALGANALALPDGTIVVTDALVQLTTNDEEILCVLAHELGHVRQRHGLRLVLQSSIVGLVTAWYIGDVSSVLAAAPAALIEAKYSRDFEADADAYAARMLRANGMSPAILADALERLAITRDRRSPAAAGATELPDYLSTHPATAERIRTLRENASQQR